MTIQQSSFSTPNLSDVRLIELYYTQTLSLLYSPDLLRRQATNFASTLNELSGNYTLMIAGVGFPFYTSEKVQAVPDEFEIYIQGEQQRIQALLTKSGNPEWPCLRCPTPDKKNCCEGHQANLHSVFKSAADIDLFVIVKDQEELEKIKEIVARLNLPTWDPPNTAEALKKYNNGEIFFDIHIITLDNLIEAFRKALELLELLNNNIEIPNDEIYALVNQKFNDIAYRGQNSWDNEHQIKLVFDILFSFDPISLNIIRIPDELKRVISRMYHIIQEIKRKNLGLRVLQRICSQLGQNSKVWRFTHQENPVFTESLVEVFYDRFTRMYTQLFGSQEI